MNGPTSKRWRNPDICGYAARDGKHLRQIDLVPHLTHAVITVSLEKEKKNTQNAPVQRNRDTISATSKIAALASTPSRRGSLELKQSAKRCQHHAGSQIEQECGNWQKREPRPKSLLPRPFLEHTDTARRAQQIGVG